MRNFVKGIFAAVAICAASYAFYACNEKVRTVRVKPPFKEVKVAFNEYTLDPTKPNEITLENGTKITIPAQAFKDAKGNIITEPVALKYREFHTPAQILASGIPMVYDSAGQTMNFQSAGMFDINAFTQNNQPVFIADGKNVTVQMASFKPGNDYNFYRFDEQENNWNYITTKPSEINQEKKEILDACSKIPDCPTAPQKPAKDALVFDLNVNYDLYPELQDFDGMMWQYAGTDPKADPKNNQWLFKEDWQYVTLDAVDRNQGLFKLHLNAGGRAFETLVKPVLRGNSYKMAMKKFDKRMQDYQVKYASMKKEEERMQKQADLMRTFQVSQFGMYNCDRQYTFQNVVALNAEIQFDQKVEAGQMTYYLVCGNDRTVVSYYPGAMSNFRFDPKSRNVLLAVLPGDKLAVYSPEDFEALNIKQLREDKSFTFRMRTMNKQIRNVADLDEVLKNI